MLYDSFLTFVILQKITDIFGHGELYLSYYGRRLLKIACEITTLQEEVCENILFLIVGFDNDQLDLVNTIYLLVTLQCSLKKVSTISILNGISNNQPIFLIAMTNSL